MSAPTSRRAKVEAIASSSHPSVGSGSFPIVATSRHVTAKVRSPLGIGPPRELDRVVSGATTSCFPWAEGVSNE